MQVLFPVAFIVNPIKGNFLEKFFLKKDGSLEAETRLKLARMSFTSQK